MVTFYRQRIKKHIEPTLGKRHANEIGVRDVRRLIDARDEDARAGHDHLDGQHPLRIAPVRREERSA